MPSADDDLISLFGDRAMTVWKLAHEEAVESFHPYLTDAHLLLALLRDDGNLAQQALENLGITHRTTRAIVASIFLPGDQMGLTAGDITLTARVKHALSMAALSARYMDRPISPQDLLLGLCQLGESIPAHIFEDFGLTADLIGGEIMRLESIGQPEWSFGEGGRPRLAPDAAQIVGEARRLAAEEGAPGATLDHLSRALRDRK